MTHGILTDKQQRDLRELGYTVVDGIFDDDVIDAVREELRAVIDGHIRAMVAEGLLATPYTELGFDRQLAQVAAIDPELGREVIRRLWAGGGDGSHMGPAIFDLMLYPRLLDAMEQVLGPEIVAASVYRVRPKVPGFAKGAVPWHQDSGYLLRHCDQELILTCWVPLVDADVENGCLYVIPRAHQAILRHHAGGPSNYLIITDDDLPRIEPLPIPVKRGGMLLMTNLTPHASFANSSDIVRWSVDLRYQSADVPNNVDLPAETDLSMLPEVEVACYPPEADCVARSRRAPETVIPDWRALKALRDRFFQAGIPPHGSDAGGRWPVYPRR